MRDHEVRLSPCSCAILQSDDLGTVRAKKIVGFDTASNRKGRGRPLRYSAAWSRPRKPPDCRCQKRA